MTKNFMDYGCLSGDIEDNIKLDLKGPSDHQHYLALKTEGYCIGSSFVLSDKILLLYLTQKSMKTSKTPYISGEIEGI